MYNLVKIKKEYSGTTWLLYVFSLLIIVCFSACYRNEQALPTQPKTSLEDLIWAYPDSALVILSAEDTAKMVKSERIQWHLNQTKAAQRAGEFVLPSHIKPCIAYFEEHADKPCLGEALYILAIAHMQNFMADSAMLTLKEIEPYLPFMDLRYSGMVYYQEAKILEMEQLYHIAYECYLKALPYIEQTNDTLRIACCLRDIARTMPAVGKDSCCLYYEKAATLAQEINNEELYYDILIQQAINTSPQDSNIIFELSSRMCRQFNMAQYAQFACEIAMARNDLQTAQSFLNDLLLDTAYSENSRHVYELLQCRLMEAEGDEQQAFIRMTEVYNTIMYEEQEKSFARTYAIARQYDVEQQQKRNLELTIRQQHLWILLGIVAFAGVLVIMVVLLVYVQEKNRRQAKEREAHLMRLEAEEKDLQLGKERLLKELTETKLQQAESHLRERRHALKQSILHRINIAKQLHLAQLGKPEMPAPVQDVLNALDFRNNENWNEFIVDFNDVYGNMLSLLTEQFPNITEQDKQYIALTLLGLSRKEVSFILGIEPQSVWNRRQRLKKHLGDNVPDVEQWLADLSKGMK